MFLIVTIITILGFTNYSFYILIIKIFPEGKVFFQEAISQTKIFTFIYTHSVAQTPVWEFFKIDDQGKMILIETHFHDHGAGLPYAAFGEEVFMSEENRFKIKNMSREINLPLYYRVYKDRGNIFIIGKKEFNLSDDIGDSLLEINVLKSNIFSYFSRKYLSKGEGK